MDHNSDDGVPGPDRLVAPKRRRMRASIACRLCRERKTRCDNRRPSCGYCRLHGATCHYPDGSRDSTLQSDENSSEVSNGTILGRVNEVLALLEQLKKDRANSEQRRPLDRSVSLGRTEETVLAHRHSQTADVFSNQEAPESAFADAGFGQLEIPHVAAQASACESILRWPILSDVMTRAGTSSSSDLRKASLSGTYEDNTHSSQKTAGVAHDSIINLCRRFLALIHIKNPILDVHEFSQHARNAAELGPGWDGGGCLVLLGCALACVSVPYGPDQAQVGASRVSSDPEDLSLAESCFAAAQRRLGLLPNTLVAVQCQYLAGLYAKFVVRPMAAWLLFQGACAQLQTLLYAKRLAFECGSGGDDTSRQGSRSTHIEQRLYWSCVKAECELRIELQLPFTSQFKYPGLFPSLSLPSSSEPQYLALNLGTHEAPSPFHMTSPWSPAAWHSSPPVATSTQGASPGAQLQPEEERSWLYYLAEISLRSIMNRVLTDLYGDGEAAWQTLGTRLARRQAVHAEDLKQWHAALPPQLAFQNPLSDSGIGGLSPAPDNELAFLLQTRFAGVSEWIFRPSLFLVLGGSKRAHHPSSLMAAASKAIHSASVVIKLVSTHHRHGGIWGLLRRSFAAALVLVAVALHNHRNPQPDVGSPLPLPDDWVQLVQLCMATIQRWAGPGSSDLVKMDDMLRRMLESSLAEINSM